jgi:hypothetical protein
MPDIVCSRCRHHNDEHANFCSACGTPLVSDGSDSTVMLTATDHGDIHGGDAEPTPQTVAFLLVRSGADAGQVYPLDKTVTTIGRSPDNDVFLDDVTVSRRHAVVVSAPEGFSVRDAGSLNGTYCNRERIAQAELHSGDVLQVGKFRFQFVHDQN